MTTPPAGATLPAMARSRTTWSREQAQALARANHAKATAASITAAKARAERRRALDLAPALLAAAQTIGPGCDFATVTLARVRAQVDRLLTRLAEHLDRKSIDGQQVRYLSGALSDLAELERVLAGRPLPGSRRPSSAEPARPPAPIISRPTIAQTAEPPPTLAEPPEW